MPFRTKFSEDTHAGVHVYFTSQPDDAQRAVLEDAIRRWLNESSSFSLDPRDPSSLAIVQGPSIGDRVMRWNIRFNGIHPQQAVRHLARILTGIDAIQIERLFVGDETVQ